MLELLNFLSKQFFCKNEHLALWGDEGVDSQNMACSQRWEKKLNIKICFKPLKKGRIWVKT